MKSRQQARQFQIMPKARKFHTLLNKGSEFDWTMLQNKIRMLFQIRRFKFKFARRQLCNVDFYFY